MYHCRFLDCNFATNNQQEYYAHSHYNLSNIITSPNANVGVAPATPMALGPVFNPEAFIHTTSDGLRTPSRKTAIGAQTSGNAAQTSAAAGTNRDAFTFDAATKARWQARHAEAAGKCTRHLEAIAETKAKIERLEAMIRAEPAWLSVYLSTAKGVDS